MGGRPLETTLDIIRPFMRSSMGLEPLFFVPWNVHRLEVLVNELICLMSRTVVFPPTKFVHDGLAKR